MKFFGLLVRFYAVSALVIPPVLAEEVPDEPVISLSDIALKSSADCFATYNSPITAGGPDFSADVSRAEARAACRDRFRGCHAVYWLIQVPNKKIAALPTSDVRAAANLLAADPYGWRDGNSQDEIGQAASWMHLRGSLQGLPGARATAVEKAIRNVLSDVPSLFPKTFEEAEREGGRYAQVVLGKAHAALQSVVEPLHRLSCETGIQRYLTTYVKEFAKMPSAPAPEPIEE